MSNGANASKPISLEVVFDLVNSVLTTADIKARITKGCFYEEQVLGDPDDPEELGDLLRQVTELRDLEPNSRLLFVGTIETDGRAIPIVATVYFREDGTFKQEGTVALEVPLTSTEEFEDESKWKPFLDWVIKLFPLILQTIEILTKGRFG